MTKLEQREKTLIEKGLVLEGALKAVDHEFEAAFQEREAAKREVERIYRKQTLQLRRKARGIEQNLRHATRERGKVDDQLAELYATQKLRA